MSGKKSKSPPQRVADLAPRFRQVIALKAEGLEDKEAAAQLSISPGTLRFYWQEIFCALPHAKRSRVIVCILYDRETRTK
jgi:DNA-binding NarL/FixJ family response regulator